MPRTKISVAQHNFDFAIFNNFCVKISIELKTTHSIDPSMLIDESRQNIRFGKKSWRKELHILYTPTFFARKFQECYTTFQYHKWFKVAAKFLIFFSWFDEFFEIYSIQWSKRNFCYDFEYMHTPRTRTRSRTHKNRLFVSDSKAKRPFLYIMNDVQHRKNGNLFELDL